MNDGIEVELCFLRYLHLDEVIEEIRGRDTSTLLAKMDIASAYRMVPVHPEDRLLLAIRWAGRLFYNTRLPFGLKSSPKIFTAVADAFQWVFQKQGVLWIGHYLNNYITVGYPGSVECRKNLETMLEWCRRLESQ